MIAKPNRVFSALKSTSLLLVASVYTGCASQGWDGASFIPPEPQSLKMFNGFDGSPMDWEQLVSACGEADVILIAERHGHPVGLPTAAALWDRVVENHENPALTLEFFDRDHQVAIDDYLAGMTTAEKFRKQARRGEASERQPNKGSLPASHLAMIDRAKDAELAVYASNSPRRYFPAMRKEGFEFERDFTAAQKAMLVLPDELVEGRYWDDFQEIMSFVHPVEDADAEKEMTEEEKAELEEKKAKAEKRVSDSFRSMNIWDATMVDTILRAIDNGASPVMHVVGNFHVNYTAGIPQRLAQRRPDLLVWTVTFVDEWSDELLEDDKDKADCVIYMGPSPAEAF